MLPACSIIALASLAFAPDAIDADQFLRLIRAAHGDCRDASLVFEGKTRFVGPPRISKVDPLENAFDFQGTYAYRHDGAVYLDLMRYSLANHPTFHDTAIRFHGKAEEKRSVPDIESGKYGVPTYAPGGFGVDPPESPNRFIKLNYFQKLTDPAGLHYQFLGWVNYEGHRCLHVQLDTHRGVAGPPKRVTRYWIDMERGGHPLKIEVYVDDNLLSRLDHIGLREERAADGKKVWFPVAGELRSYLWQDKYYSNPIIESIYYVTDGSLRLNQGLGDEVFRLDAPRNLTDPLGLRKARPGSGTVLKLPSLRSDPAGLKQELDKQLAEARRQSTLLEASSPARDGGGWMPVVQYGGVALGVGLLASAVVLRRKFG